ncbi:MAG: LysM peptidoglycan-binding domain-containing protein [Anaerolineae bacterium]|nr:LysM peptidoglycan-binding domain-containing protein [Anaerolineae bacterium]
MPFTNLRAQDDVGDLLGRINALRASVGRAPYALSGALSAAAQDQAQWMASTGTVSHTRPDGSGPRTRALNAGYPSSDVSENIYGGSSATAGDAWTFWINSEIHYRGLVNDRYQEVGIGVGHAAWGTAYVLVFGNPGGGSAPISVASNGGASAGSSAPPAQPAYVVGVDEYGNILHEVQPGDTLGDILLIYGYTWDVLPYLQSINGIADVRDLEIGSILRIPPKAGTYTPTPGGENPESGVTPTPLYPTPYPENLDEMTATPSPAPTVPGIATLADLPLALAAAPTAVPSGTPTEVAMLSTSAPVSQAVVSAATTSPGRSLPTWLIVGLGVQVAVLAGAGVEFLRRSRRR